VVQPTWIGIGPGKRVRATDPHFADLARLDVSDGKKHAADVRERLFPGRVLDHHRRHVPVEGPQPGPHARRDRLDEVREDEHQRAGRERRSILDQQPQAAVEGIVPDPGDAREARRAATKTGSFRTNPGLATPRLVRPRDFLTGSDIVLDMVGHGTQVSATIVLCPTPMDQGDGTYPYRAFVDNRNLGVVRARDGTIVVLDFDPID